MQLSFSTSGRVAPTGAAQAQRATRQQRIMVFSGFRRADALLGGGSSRATLHAAVRRARGAARGASRAPVKMMFEREWGWGAQGRQESLGMAGACVCRWGRDQHRSREDRAAAAGEWGRRGEGGSTHMMVGHHLRLPGAGAHQPRRGAQRGPAAAGHRPDRATSP